MLPVTLYTHSDDYPLPPLDQRSPSALLPMLGKNKLVFWVEHCYRAGLRELTIVSHHRALIEKSLGNGEKFGVTLTHTDTSNHTRDGWHINADLLVDFDSQVFVEPGKNGEQLIIDGQLLAQFGQPPCEAARFGELAITDSATEVRGTLLPFASVQDFHRAVMAILSGKTASLTPAGLLNEAAPNIRLDGIVDWQADSLKAGHFYGGDGSHLHKSVKITGNAAIEHDCYIEREAILHDAIVMPDTYVGAMTELKHCIVWGRTLIRVDTDTVVEIPDDMILADHSARRESRLTGKLRRWLKKG